MRLNIVDAFSEEDEELTLVTPPAVDETATTSEASEEPSMLADDAEPKPKRKARPTRIGEISALAEKNRHVYRMSDGTLEAVYTAPPAEYDPDEVDDEPIPEEDGKHYRQRRPHFTARFSRDEENDELFSVEQGEYRVTVSAKKKKRPHPHGTLPVRHENALVFKGVKDGTDYEYAVRDDGVKENIIVKKPAASYTYAFLLHCKGLHALLSEDATRVSFVDGNETEIFHIPAPFMTDAEGVRSESLSYSLEAADEDTYTLTVTADAEWMNDEARVFPVTIDPQILLSGTSYISVTHNQYEWYDLYCDDYGCYESYWMHTGNPSYPYIYLYDNGSYKTTARLRIKKSNIDLTRNNLISAKLVFEQYSGQNYSSGASIKIGNNYYTHYNGSPLTANITSLYNTQSSDFTIDLAMSSVGKSRKFYIPTLQIEYRPINDDPVRKTLSVATGASAEFDVLSGGATLSFDDITDPVLGVSVSHVYKPNDAIVEYGQNFRLNLDEQLAKTITTSTGAQYVYTDPNGDAHTFKEHFYKIGTNGEKLYITSGISSITADADGRLWLSGTEVFRELTTDRGLRASARLEGVVNNAEWVEQRLDEEKQLEEQVKSYKNTLCNFASVNKETGAIASNMTEIEVSSPDSVESFLSEIDGGSHLLLSKEEALSYKSLLTQKESLNTSKTALMLQKESIKNSAKTLLLQYDSHDSISYQRQACNVQSDSLNLECTALNNTIQRLGLEGLTTAEQYEYNTAVAKRNFISTQRNLLNSNYTLITNQESDLREQEYHIADQIRNFPGITAPTGNDGTLTKQYNNTQDQINILSKQLVDINTQITRYVEKSENYISQFKSYYKEYLNREKQLETLKGQIPVAYLISDTVVKGFNAYGELVIIQDKHGKNIVVEREEYTADGNARISAVYDQDGKTMSFSYNESNKLSEICNTLGERVTFRYDASGCLIAIEHSNAPSLTISYNTVANENKISKVESTNNTYAALSYNHTGMLATISHNTTVNKIAHDNITIGPESTVSVMNVEYTSTETKLTYDNIKQEIYKIDQSTELVDAHYELVNGLVTGAERYTYNGYQLVKTEHADKSCLGRYSYAEFAAQMQIETVEEMTYNSFKEQTSVVVSKYAIPHNDDDCPLERTKVEYFYNDDHKLIEKKATHWYYNTGVAFDSTVAVEKYHYNNAGELVRKESYVEGEELKTGIHTEEHVFNDKGFEIQSFTYNSLDPSSKFYTENEVDENGKVLCALDESGEYKTVFDYERDGVTVKTERLPNGSKFSYGRDKDGTMTAITHSTEHGEENSTIQLRTLDVVTEVKSGNHTVRYEYDEKRRVKSVSLNGVDDYVTYTYSGENTNAETVTATMAGGTVATSIKNAHGNVTKSTCGDHTVTNTYNDDQQLETTVDSVSGETSLTYGDKGKITSVTAPDHSEAFAYNAQDNTLESKTLTINGVSHTYEYGYKATADKALDSISVAGTTVRPQTDALGRSTGKTIAVGDAKIAEENISYIKFGDHATSLPSTVRFAENGVFRENIQYRYDNMGNIIEVFENGRSVYRYEYDALGRLTREDSVTFSKTTTWAYDNNGNILARYEYALTAKPTNELHLLDCAVYDYCYADNSDQLVSFNGEAFAYDAIGNPTTYRGKAATWAYGRQLTSYDGNTFSYDARGRRISKNDITFTYDSNGNLIKQSNGLEFLYDHTGVFAVKQGVSTYFYRKNAQNDIIALLDSTGTVVVKYKYDAWGKCQTTVLTSTASTIAELNPFRYRSYYLDTETSLYFLKTRYYDPEIGRFTTIDDISYLDPESINGLNLYAYCLNNPVMMVDNSGCTPAWWQWLVSGLTLAAGIALCFVPGGQAFGVGLIVAGATSMTSNILSAAGVDGKTATIVTNVLSIVGGIALCFTPFAAIGASMIGSGLLGIAGGYVSEALGGSFELGSAIGNIVGGIIGDGIYRGLQSIGKAGVYVKLRDFKYNPDDDFIKLGPSDKALSYWRKTLSQNPRGYNTIPNMDGEVEVIKIIKHTSNMLANGHHRIYVLRTLNNAPKYIKVFLTK